MLSDAVNVAYSVGDIVRVRTMTMLGHVRTPAYARGKLGTVVRVVGTFDNPEELAWNRPGDKRVLYRVRFPSSELFPNDTRQDDTVDIELYEHWLEQV
jgi:hypothetical protein